jgi:hypothetical protein
MTSPVNTMIDAVVRCVICALPPATCECWVRCNCGWFALRGFSCRNRASTACTTKLTGARAWTTDDVMKRRQEIGAFWKVERNGGRRDTPWRLLGAYLTETHARARYELEVQKMRQGGVQLRRPDGELEHRTTAPRIRTRW